MNYFSFGLILAVSFGIAGFFSNSELGEKTKFFRAFVTNFVFMSICIGGMLYYQVGFFENWGFGYKGVGVVLGASVFFSTIIGLKAVYPDLR
ncbi:hypothetical protein [Teredinibacter turnerae]|uniref:hypothetical protein n=1 Tax=Teredinibacter turnerae TaxID=2426 RepID=UPI0005F87A89|nr:hypothetical protein [Teredinibacter turnerae]